MQEDSGMKNFAGKVLGRITIVWQMPQSDEVIESL